MNVTLARMLFFPLHERLKRHPTMAALREARRWDRLTPEALEGAWLDKLRAMLNHAYAHTAYYRDAFDRAGVKPDDVRDVEDLTRIPRLERRALREHRDAFVATDRPRKMTAVPTGGSTGEPVVVMVDRRRAAVNTAARIRAREWWGIRNGEREAVLWASPIEIGAQDRVRSIRDHLLNSRLFSAFEGSVEGLDTLWRSLARYRPAALYGYASSIHLLAAHILEREPNGVDIGLKGIFATAEGMSDAERDVVTRALRAPVAGEYGARDAGLITHQCPDGEHHILAEGMFVEVVKPDGTHAAPGERGEIVTTHLEAYGFPLIRYRTGDVGIPAAGTSRCGLPLPRLEKVEGRATDFLLAPDGRLLHALGAIYVVRVLPGVGAFRVEQPEPDRLIVRVVREEGFPEDGEATIRDGMTKLMRGDVTVTVRFVDEIPPAKSGKHRYVVSPVAQAAIRGRRGGSAGE